MNANLLQTNAKAVCGCSYGRHFLSRRQFVLSACCVAVASRCEAAASDDTRFCCGTIERFSSLGLLVTPFAPNAKVVIETPAPIDAPEELKLSPYGTASATDAWTAGDAPQVNGKLTLNVHFLRGDDNQRSQWKTGANAWLSTDIGGKFGLVYVDDIRGSHLRIDFDPADPRGDWSYVGKDNLAHGRSQKTMNITKPTQHAIQHEIGHVFGLRHEHQYPGDDIRWYPKKVEADMWKYAHWPAAVTQEQILTKYNKSYVCLGDKQFNPTSIMMYPIWPRWADVLDPITRQWREWTTPSDNTITDRDVKCAVSLYTKLGAH
jgi:hypothetical protein